MSRKLTISFAVILLAAAGLGLYSHYLAQVGGTTEVRVASDRANEFRSGNHDSQNANKLAEEVRTVVAGRKTVVQYYSYLAAAAERGNGQAAYQLYQDLLRCSTMSVRRDVLEGYAASNSNQNATNEIVSQIAADTVACEGLTDEQLSRKADWVIKAARLGNTDAQLAFFGAAMEKYDTPEKVIANAEEIVKVKGEALRHLQSAASTGNETALHNLAMAYKEGTLAKSDAVMAYAYMRALQRTGTAQSSSRILNSWAQGMTSQQIGQAETLSRQIITGSP